MPAEVSATRPLSARTDRRRALISLTPLIDVVFILLVFFMLASSFLDWRAIDLSPPVEAGGGARLEGSLLVDIRRDALRLAGEPMDLETLADRIGVLVADKPGRPVILRPAPDVSLQRTVEVLDRLGAAGAAGMALIRAGGRR
ncbi:MAG: ExbD/TolR family protein [Minwuia sp.]|uniref:ExbD/TolR family protein n=1 Tax=Minwuia sp. TaxID=2493630 RepID=UPI003A83758D